MHYRRPENSFASLVQHEFCQSLPYLLISAEMNPRGYYLEDVFYLDHVIFTNMSHVYYLDQ